MSDGVWRSETELEKKIRKGRKERKNRDRTLSRLVLAVIGLRNKQNGSICGVFLGKGFMQDPKKRLQECNKYNVCYLEGRMFGEG